MSRESHWLALALMLCPLEDWQEGTDDMLTNVERVYETRIDCPAGRLRAAVEIAGCFLWAMFHLADAEMGTL